MSARADTIEAASRAAGERRARASVLLFFVGLAGVAAVVFWPSISTGFFEDDFGYLNATLGPSWWRSGFFWDFSSQVLRPVTVLGIGLQREVFGFHPLPFHLVALGMLVGIGALLYLVSRRLRLGRVGACAAAAVVVLHTTNGWTLSWTASTSSFYAELLCLAVIWCIAVPRPGRRGWTAAVVLYALALLSREVSMALPFIAVLVRWYVVAGRGPDGTAVEGAAPDGDGGISPWARLRAALREVVPLFVVLGVFLAARFGASAYAKSKPEVPRVVPLLNWTSFSDAFPDIPRHVHDLAVLGASPVRSSMDLAGLHFPVAVVVVAVLVWAAIIALTIVDARRGRWLAAVGLGWFLVGIAPAIFLQPGITYGNYTDLALPGLALAIGALVQPRVASIPVRLRPVAAVAGVAVLAVVAWHGGNCLVQPPPPLITRATQLEAWARRTYPDPAPGSTIVVADAQPNDVLWTSNGDLFRAMYDDPSLRVEFRPPG